MKKESMQAYSKRIAQANRTELIVITYEIIIEHIKNAQISFGNQKEFRSGTGFSKRVNGQFGL